MDLSDESCKYILRARQMVMEDKYDKAFDILLAAFQRIPSLIPIHETEFCAVLLMLNTMLDSEGNRLPVIFNNFAKALKIFPNNPLLLNDIGKYLYKYGCYKEALKQFEEVLKISPTFANAEKNMNSIKNLLVERWHYRMLNDSLRNEYYRRVIHQTVTPQEDNVLDVGTGTGLLAIYAYEAGSPKIIGCDGSKVMCNLADNIVRGNKIKKITIINKMSTELTLWDLGGRCSVLVTEMFDAGLFGEHVLQMLSHAWPDFLSDKASVVPKSAEFFAVGVQCHHLSINYKLSSAAKSLLNIPSLNVHVSSKDESYDCEDVHLIKDIKYLTEPMSVLKVNFNDLNDINTNLKRTDPFDVELVATENGLMNIVIGWFNLYLSDTVTITTDPKAPDRANAWQQAVFFDDIPRTVKENETINLKFLMNGGNLTMAPTSDSPITRASSEIIRFLNDSEYINMISSCIPAACAHLTQTKDITELCILDLCPFPLFGLKMLKNGAKFLRCCAANDNDKDFIIKVFLENKVPESKVSFLLGDDWTSEEFEGNRYHAIFNHTLELCGDVNVRRQQVVDYVRENQLESGGLFLPAQIKLVAQLVSSHWLDLNNRLYDENVSNYTMASHLNKYKVTQNFAIDFSTLKYVAISEPTVICSYPNSKKCEEKPVRVISDGYANAILCWYNIQLMEQMQEISTHRPSSLISGMLFLTYSKVQLIGGNMAKIVLHQDSDGGFKLIMVAA